MSVPLVIVVMLMPVVVLVLLLVIVLLTYFHKTPTLAHARVTFKNNLEISCFVLVKHKD
jgi:hypothetical protein